MDEDSPVLPGGFLGGSAPCLREIYLDGIPFPTLPTLLLSTSNLAILTLSMIPPTGIISPEAMVTCLAVLPSLESLTIEFHTSTPYPDRISPTPATRTVLPALASFNFQGACEYLEEFVAQIDGPQLNDIWIVYMDEPYDFQVTQLSKFVDSSVGPELTPSRRAHVTFHVNRVVFILYRQENYLGGDQRSVETSIYPDELNWGITEMAEVLSRFSATLSTVVHLELEFQFMDDESLLESANNVDWLYLFRHFPAMRILDVSWGLAMHVAIALEDITTELATEVFPSLHLVFLEGEPAPSIETIFAAGSLSNRPVTFVETRGV